MSDPLKPAPVATKTRKKPAVIALVIYLGVLSFAVWKLTSWHNLRDTQRSTAIAAGVFGLYATVTWLMNSFGMALGRQIGLSDAADPEAVGQDWDQLSTAMFAPLPVEFRDASTLDFADLDEAFYTRVTDEIRDLGFRTHSDVVSLKIERAAPWSRSVLRPFLHRDGMTFGAMYHLRFTGPMRLLTWIGLAPRRVKIIDMEAELSDGTFVVACNAAGLNRTVDTPGIARVLLPRSESASAVFAAHQRLLAAIIATRPGVTAVVMRSRADVLAAASRLDVLRANFRNSDKHDNFKEMAQIAGRPLNEDELIAADAQRRAREERLGRNPSD